MLLLGSDLSLADHKISKCDIESLGYSNLQTLSYQNLYVLKVTMLGDYGVGKTTLAHTFYSAVKENPVRCSSPNTIYGGNIRLNDDMVTLRLIDTAGEERFRSITASYYRGTNCCLLVFNTANRKSFLNIETWYEDASRMISGFEDITVIIIGIHKKSEKRQVTSEQCKQFADFKDLPYVEIDLENESTVLKVFKIIASHCIIKYKRHSSFSSSLGTSSISSSDSDKTIVKLMEKANGKLPRCTC